MFIEVKSISPISKYQFSKAAKYVLIFINMGTIHKININKIDNINQINRAFIVNRSIKGSDYPYYSIKLFKYQNGQIQLLFSKNININNIDFEHKHFITLLAPTDAKYANFINDTTYLSEQFYNFDETESENKCLLFVTRTPAPRTLIIKPMVLNLANNFVIYDRMSDNLIKEYLPPNIKYTNTNKAHMEHINNFINNGCNLKNYQISKKDRSVKMEPYINNIVSTPVDGRVRGFNINPTLKFLLFGKQYDISDITFKHYDTTNGSGLVCRMAPQDHKRVFMPYSGYLKKVEKRKNMVIIKFDSNYFMPHSVKERDYLSVLYGNYTHPGVGVGAATRHYPEVLEPQPNTQLIFYVVIISPKNDMIELSNKLNNHNTWFQQNEIIASFKCVGGFVLFICNRPLDFTADIKKYSKIDKKNIIKNQTECLLRANDIAAMIT